MVNETDMEKLYGMMVLIIKGNGMMISKMEKDFFRILAVITTIQVIS